MRYARTIENHYYGVTSPFPVEVRVGLRKSQVFIGSSMALQDLYQTVTVQPGDELHLLVGGDFLIRNGVAYAFDTRQHQASEIMLHPAPWDPDLPMDHLVEISRDQAHRPAAYRHEFEVDGLALQVPA